MAKADPVPSKMSSGFSLPFGARPRPVSHYQVTLVLLAVLPLVVAFGVLAWWQSVVLRNSIDRGMLSAAQALSLAVDREVGIVREKLDTLADSGAIDRRDLAEFYREATHAIGDRSGSWIVLTGASGQQLINTTLPFGARLPNRLDAVQESAGENGLSVGGARYIREVFETRRAKNSDLFMSIVNKVPVIAISVPVVRHGAVTHVLTITLPPQEFTDLLLAAPFEKQGGSALIDRNGFIITRTQQPERFIGSKVSPSLAVPSASGPAEGLGAGTTLSGERIYRSYVRSPVTGWTVSVGVRQAIVDREVIAGLMRTALVAAIGLILSVLLALRFSYRLGSPIIALAAKASGKPASEPVGGIVSAELTELARAIEAGSRAREAEAKERELRVAAEARKDEADAANRAKDQFLAMLGHELRNPLAAISNAAAVMEQAPAVSTSMTTIVKRQSEHLRKLVDDLLDVARVTSGKIRLLHENIDLYEVASACTENFVRTGRSASHSVELKGSSTFVYADHHRMTQVLTNLLDNALKFTPPGGRITVTVGAAGEDALLRVADTGAGIPRDALSRIFDVFVQGDQSFDRGRGGLGLGLALAKSLVEMHHGRIVAESEGAGRGAVFTVRIPRVQHSAGTNPADPDRSRAGGVQRRRVLVVEDHPDTRKALRTLLEIAGHQVLEAADGTSALAIARGSPVDVAFVDLGLPDIDGFGIARAFRADETLRGVRLIALTGYGQPENREKAFAAGFHDFVIKPIEEKTLNRLLG